MIFFYEQIPHPHLFCVFFCQCRGYAAWHPLHYCYSEPGISYKALRSAGGVGAPYACFYGCSGKEENIAVRSGQRKNIFIKERLMLDCKCELAT